MAKEVSTSILHAMLDARLGLHWVLIGTLLTRGSLGVPRQTAYSALAYLPGAWKTKTGERGDEGVGAVLPRYPLLPPTITTIAKVNICADPKQGFIYCDTFISLHRRCHFYEESARSNRQSELNFPNSSWWWLTGWYLTSTHNLATLLLLGVENVHPTEA